MTDFLHTFALILYLTGWVQWAGVAHRARDDGGWWLLLAALGVIWPVIVAEQAAEQMLRSDDQ